MKPDKSPVSHVNAREAVVTPEEDHFHLTRLPAKFYTIAPIGLELIRSGMATEYEDSFLTYLGRKKSEGNDVADLTSPGSLDLIFFCFDFSRYPYVGCSSNGWKYNGKLLIPSRRTFSLRQKTQGEMYEVTARRNRKHRTSGFEGILIGYERARMEDCINKINRENLSLIMGENHPAYMEWRSKLFWGRLAL